MIHLDLSWIAFDHIFLLWVQEFSVRNEEILSWWRMRTASKWGNSIIRPAVVIISRRMVSPRTVYMRRPAKQPKKTSPRHSWIKETINQQFACNALLTEFWTLSLDRRHTLNSSYRCETWVIATTVHRRSPSVGLSVKVWRFSRIASSMRNCLSAENFACNWPISRHKTR